MNDIPTNTIAKDQNSDSQLLRLAAMSQIYSRAKTVLAFQFILTVPAGLASAILASQWPSLKPWTVTWSFGVALLDALFLEKHQNRLKKQGAKIQEAFDCGVLGLPWRKLKAGKPVDTEIVREQGKAFLGKHPKATGIRDWYPPIVSEIPLSFARLICQRANCWWDAKLRRSYSNALTLILCVLSLFIIGFGLHANRTLGQLALAVVAPLSPALLWGIREIRKQEEAAEALDKLRSDVEGVWEQAINGTIAEDGLHQTSVEFQNEIFDRRSRHPLIFNWINESVRDKQQESMEAKASEMVAEAKARRRGPKSIDAKP